MPDPDRHMFCFGNGLDELDKLDLPEVIKDAFADMGENCMIENFILPDDKPEYHESPYPMDAVHEKPLKIYTPCDFPEFMSFFLECIAGELEPANEPPERPGEDSYHLLFTLSNMFHKAEIAEGTEPLPENEVNGYVITLPMVGYKELQK